MFISEAELQRRLSSHKNIATILPSRPSVFNKPSAFQRPVSSGAVAPEPESVTQDPAKLAPDVVAVIGASLVQQGVSQETVCKELSVAPDQIKQANPKRVQSSIDRVRELAIDRLMITLGLMKPEMLESASLKELSNCTANLSRVLGKTAPRELNDNRVQFMVYSPAIRRLDDFPILNV